MWLRVDCTRPHLHFLPPLLLGLDLELREGIACERKIILVWSLPGCGGIQVQGQTKFFIKTPPAEETSAA